MRKRDYSLLGTEGPRAVEAGLASADWYRTPVSREIMKDLMQRSDGPATRDTLIWLGCLIGFAGLGIALWPSIWSLPFWLAYGVLYGSAGDSRWHECGHGTAFKTRWKNRVVYQIACFMMIRNPVQWKWSHARHHADTIIVGRDPEIGVMRPPAALVLVANLFGIVDSYNGLRDMLIFATGRIPAEQASYIPETEYGKATLTARIWILIYAATIVLSIGIGSMLPLMLIGLPRLYGAWHHVMTGLLQHGGLADDVLDHRLNTRTVYMNPISRFIYLDMNYHIEHHMFPQIPYHRLKDLHIVIKADLPPPSRSIAAAYAEMLPVLWQQLKGRDVFIKRELPTA